MATTTMPGTGKRTAKGTSTIHLTQNDSKILGPNITKKLEKTLPAQQFQTRSFKTQKSSWTPIWNKTANERVCLKLGQCRAQPFNCQQVHSYLSLLLFTILFKSEYIFYGDEALRPGFMNKFDCKFFMYIYLFLIQYCCKIAITVS